MGTSVRRAMYHEFKNASLVDTGDLSVADTSGYPPKYHWGKEDKQPMQLPHPTAHLKVTKKLLPNYLALGVDMLIDAGFVRSEQKEATIEKLQNIYAKRREEIAELLCDDVVIRAKQKDQVLKRLKTAGDCPSNEEIADMLMKAELTNHVGTAAVLHKLAALPKRPFVQLSSDDPDLGDVKVLWRIKDEKSAYTKMRLDGKAPEEIGDYFGMRFIPNTVKGAVALRAASLTDSMSSRKCEFSVPSKEIFLSHKSHNTVSNDDSIQSAEFQIIHEALASREGITHRLKEMEDSMKSWNEGKDTVFSDKDPSKLGPKVRGRVAVCAEELRQVRIYINGTAAVSSGLLAMALPEERERVMNDLLKARQAVQNVSQYTEKLLDRLEGIEGYVGTIKNAAKIRTISANEWLGPKAAGT